MFAPQSMLQIAPLLHCMRQLGAVQVKWHVAALLQLQVESAHSAVQVLA